MGSSGSPAKPTIVEEFYTYDRASNRTGRYDERPGAVTANSDSRFVYDGLHRLRTEERGRAAGGYGGGWTFAPLSRQWDLDLLGNWRELRYDVSNGSSGPPNGVFGDGDDAEEVRDHNMANEIVERTPSGVGALGFAHDHAGNTRTVLDSSDDGTRYTHDAWNRLVRVETVEGGSAFATELRSIWITRGRPVVRESQAAPEEPDHAHPDPRRSFGAAGLAGLGAIARPCSRTAAPAASCGPGHSCQRPDRNGLIGCGTRMFEMLHRWPSRPAHRGRVRRDTTRVRRLRGVCGSQPRAIGMSRHVSDR